MHIVEIWIAPSFNKNNRNSSKVIEYFVLLCYFRLYQYSDMFIQTYMSIVPFGTSKLMAFQPKTSIDKNEYKGDDVYDCKNPRFYIVMQE